jgi:hypothetical protein
MTARQIEQAGTKLHDLHARAVGDLALAAVAFALAVAAGQLRPSLALPLLAGATAVTFLGARAFVQHSFLVEDLAVDPDAYVLADVRRYGTRAASLEHRRALAGALRAALREEDVSLELIELVAALEDEARPLPPYAVVCLERSLLQSASPDEVRSQLRALLDR